MLNFLIFGVVIGLPILQFMCMQICPTMIWFEGKIKRKKQMLVTSNVRERGATGRLLPSCHHRCTQACTLWWPRTVPWTALRPPRQKRSSVLIIMNCKVLVPSWKRSRLTYACSKVNSATYGFYFANLFLCKTNA